MDLSAIRMTSVGGTGHPSHCTQNTVPGTLRGTGSGGVNRLAAQRSRASGRLPYWTLRAVECTSASIVDRDDAVANQGVLSLAAACKCAMADCLCGLKF